MICRACIRASRKRGKHREHYCQGGGGDRYIGWSCNCECQLKAIEAIMSHGGFPSMYLD